MKIAGVVAAAAVCGVLLGGAQSCGQHAGVSGVGISGSGGGAAVVMPRMWIRQGAGSGKWLVAAAGAAGIGKAITEEEPLLKVGTGAGGSGEDPCAGREDSWVFARWHSNWPAGAGRGWAQRPWMDCKTYRRIMNIKTSGRAKWRTEVDEQGRVNWGSNVDMRFTGYRPTPFQVLNCITRVLSQGAPTEVFDRVIWYLRSTGVVSGAAGWVRPVIAAVAVNGNGRIGAIYPSEWSEKGWRACAGE